VETAPFRRRNPRVNQPDRRENPRLRAPMAPPKFFAALLAAGVALGVAPAAAQWGTIFGDSPRPPGNVPDRQPYPPPPPDSRGRAPPPGAVQSQPLPPPGTQSGQQGALQRQNPVPGSPPGQRQPRGAPQQQGTAAPQPGDEVVTAPVVEKIANPTAVFSGLDKITGRTITFDVAINETVQFGALQVTPHACYTRPPTETPNTDGFVDVDEVTLQGETKRIFTGWMFAASPGLHAVEHPIYDVWLVDCKKEPPSLAAASGSSAAAPPPQAAPAPPSPAPAPATPAAPKPATPAQAANPALRR
jgi:hypothetical protein